MVLDGLSKKISSKIVIYNIKEYIGFQIQPGLPLYLFLKEIIIQSIFSYMEDIGGK